VALAAASPLVRPRNVDKLNETAGLIAPAAYWVVGAT
jgi:hypothetical protein